MTTAKITEWNVKVLLSQNNQEYVNDLESEFQSGCENLKRPIFTSKERDLLCKLPILNKQVTLPILAKTGRSEDKTLKSSKTLGLNNIISLYNKLQCKDDKIDKNRYFHEILEEAELLIPENEIIPRNPQLEERCKKLRMEQENVEYANMTKNVDSARKTLPEDTISYQIKALNKQLIAIFQFVVSVITGFAFGFIGLELIFGGMEFGFRLLLGIICALIIALAEIYFLAKKLNEYDEFIDSPKHTYVSVSKKND